MILTVTELKQYISTEESDDMLKSRLTSLELMIRAYTNNNFMKRPFRAIAISQAEHNLITNGSIPFKAGDTLQITESDLMNDQLVTVQSVTGGTIVVAENLYDESGVVITKVEYPSDVKMGIINLMKWELENREKVGVQSETISRHSVTYFNMDGDNSVMGYPRSLMGFLKPYMKARFGRGIGK